MEIIKETPKNVPNNKIMNNHRLPQDFMPEKYNIEFYLDYKNIKYEVNSEIEIIVDSDQAEMLIINSDLRNYKISSILVAKHDNISDHFLEPLPVRWLSNTQISNLFDRSEVKVVYDNLILNSDVDLRTLSQENKLNLINSNLKEFYPYLYKLNSEFFQWKNFNLVNYIEEKDSLFIVEESIYIPLNIERFNLKKHDRIKLIMKIEGDIRLSSENSAGLYLSLLGNDAKLLEDKKIFMNNWNDTSLNQNLIKNSYICVINEPVEARTFIPCFDEPIFKSKFNIRVKVDKKIIQDNKFYKVMSNGDLMDILDENDKLIYKFSESPLMSIYLLTFVAGNYEFLESMVGKTRLRVYTPVNQQNDGTFGMEIAQKSLEFYQNYFQIPYSFPKLDLIPVPAMDYRALESWGCVVFLNYSLMANKLLDIKERKSIARTTSHELSHMWFGNLVTMKWWDDIWLNEGFARFMEFECLDKIKPEWEIWSKFIELILESALVIDERVKTHPVRCEISKPRELNKIFDTISYAKGSSIIRMLTNYVGKDRFREAIIKYMEKFQYKNTSTNDLWDIVKSSLNIDAALLMDSWLNLAGHPKIDVELKEMDKEWVLLLTQSPYPENFNKTVIDPIWKIPLFIKTKEKEFIFLMEEKTFTLNISKQLNLTYDDLVNNKNFIKVNNDLKGFYRVFYNDNILFDGLIKNCKNLSKFNIVGLLSDYFSSSDLKTCLRILNAAKPISDYLILSYANKIYKMIEEFAFQFTCFKELLIKDEQNYKLKYECLVNLQEQVNSFYFDLLTNGDQNILSDLKKEIMTKIYLSDSSNYFNEEKDEFHDIILYFLCFIKKDEEVIKYIVENFEKSHPVLHKNFKYIVYSVITNYMFKVLKDHDKESLLFNQMLDEFIKSYFDLSLQSKKLFVESMMRMEDASHNLIEIFATKYQDKDTRYKYFNNYNLFSNFPNNRKIFVNVYIKMMKDKYDSDIDFDDSANWNDSLSEVGNTNPCNELLYLFQDIYDDNLKTVLKDYIVEELKKHRPDADCTDEQFEPIHKLTKLAKSETYCKKADKVVSQVLDYFKH